MMKVIEDTFLHIVRFGIGTADRVTFPENINWSEIETLAEKQGLSAIIVDGIGKLPESIRPPKEILLQWIGNTLQCYEYRYEKYCSSMSGLASFYNQHSFQMMVLKGYACALNWPKPEHRPCGDLDIWLFGKQKEADAILSQEKGIKVDSSHHHHTVFNWGDITVENHYDFINVYDYKSSKDIEKILKELGQDDSFFTEVNGERVYLPSPNLHALFLIRHAASHFASTYITLRQVLDWAFFVQKHTNEIDWDWLKDILRKYHMMDFFNCINAICVEDLGFSSGIFPGVQFSPVLKEKVLRDILSPEFTIEEPNSFIPRLLYKYKRWYGNGWKQKLCYEDSRISGFLSNLWAHILKPSSFFS